MEPLTIKTPADVLSFIGHTLGFWPQESLVCITLDANRVGATLRVDLPTREGGLGYARTVADYLAHDTSAASVLFAVYTSETQQPGQPKPHAATIAALTCALAERGMTIRDGLLVGDNTVSPYDGDPQDGLTLPVKATQSSQINAEFVYRGSTIAPTNHITLPASTKERRTADAVDDRVKAIHRMNPGEALEHASTLWDGMLDAISYPNDDQTLNLIANFQAPAIRDQLMADIPGIDEPMDRVLLAQTHGGPQWSRVEWAQQLLLHAYTHSSTKHSAPILTAIAFVNWWEGRGSKAHQFLQLALEADPAYRLARLSDLMIGSGMVAGWNMDKDRAYRGPGASKPPRRAVIGIRTTTAGRSGASPPPPRPTRPDRNSTPAHAPRRGSEQRCQPGTPKSGGPTTPGLPGRRVRIPHTWTPSTDRTPATGTP